MKTVTILGATGSIGQSTIDLIKRHQSKYRVIALTGGRNLRQLAEDAISLDVSFVATCYPECESELREKLAGYEIEVGSGENALVHAASMGADWTMSAIVGAAGLGPGLKALESGGTLALANKESLVTAGPILMAKAKEFGATILPVDSEHSAIFQALVGEKIETVERVIITASGGAFRDWPIEELPNATLAQASKHPNWDMGQRITIDSASMFNKAMELIETKEFFGLPPEKIEVLVHPQSLVHALVGFQDGGLMAHVGPPDMRHAIGYALHWPDRQFLPVDRLDLAKIGMLNFSEADHKRYPALKIANEVMETGGLTGAVFTAAKEIALDGFIAGSLKFTEMANVVSRTLDKMSAQPGLQNAQFTLDNVLETDKVSRKYATEIIIS